MEDNSNHTLQQNGQHLPILEGSSLPPGITLQQIMEALAAQSQTISHTSTNTAATVDEREALIDIPFTPETLLSSTTTNLKQISCVFCATPILLPNTATFKHESIMLHPFDYTRRQGQQGRVTSTTDEASTQEDEESNMPIPYPHVWCVRDQMDFENVGVTRPILTRTSSSRDYKYLCCGNCDRGPIGITYMDTPNMFYVAHGRIAYTER